MSWWGERNPRASPKRRAPLQPGHVVGRLTIVGQGGYKQMPGSIRKLPMVRVRCECGTEKEISVASVVRAVPVQSCGCLKRARTN